MDWIVDWIQELLTPPPAPPPAQELPRVAPMRVSSQPAPVPRLPPAHALEPVSARLMRLLMSEWSAEGLDPDDVEGALEAFRARAPFRVAFAPPDQVLACEVAGGEARWVWLARGFGRHLAGEWFN